MKFDCMHRCISIEEMEVVQSLMTSSNDRDVEHFLNSENEVLMRCTMLISIDHRKRLCLSIGGLTCHTFTVTSSIGISSHFKIDHNNLISLFETFIIFQDKLVSCAFPIK